MTAFALPTEDDEVEQLKRLLGVELGEAPIGGADLDAYISDCLRRMGEEDEDIRRDQESLEAEVARIHMRYLNRMSRAKARRGYLEARVLELAAVADYGPKRKSRSVGYGKYGVKQEPERLKKVDDAALLAWALKNRPEVVVSRTAQSVPHDAVVTLFKETGEIPAGVEYTASAEKPFCKVELL